MLNTPKLYHLTLMINIVNPVLIGQSNIDKTKTLMTNGRLIHSGQKYRRILPLGTFCNTFDLH